MESDEYLAIKSLPHNHSSVQDQTVCSQLLTSQLLTDDCSPAIRCVDVPTFVLFKVLVLFVIINV